MTIQEMKDKKRELGYSYEQIAELSGLPCSTIQKIFGGTTRFPRRTTIASLEKVLGVSAPLRDNTRRKEETVYSGYNDSIKKESAGREGITDRIGTVYPGAGPDCLQEPGGQYQTEMYDHGKHTVTEYFHFPQNMGRCELIDGVVYNMSSPDAAHQGMSLRLGSLFLRHVDDNDGNCRVYTAPFDVVPDPGDKYTVVQPDVMIICDPSKIRNGYCEGPPDLVVEIMSPSSRRRDLIIKHSKYAAAGVREYWIVDIEAQAVVIYDFEHEALPKICGFSTPVPVGIWDGACTVDFSEILAKL